MREREVCDPPSYSDSWSRDWDRRRKDSMVYCFAFGCNNRPIAELRTTKGITFHKWVHYYLLDIVCNAYLSFWYSVRRDFRQWCKLQSAELGSSLWFSRANVFIILINGSYLQNMSRSIKWEHAELVRKRSLPCSKAKPKNSSLCMHSLMTNDSYWVSVWALFGFKQGLK